MAGQQPSRASGEPVYGVLEQIHVLLGDQGADQVLVGAQGHRQAAAQLHQEQLQDAVV